MGSSRGIRPSDPWKVEQMTDEVVTKDQGRFGFRELKMGARLLTAWKSDADETELLTSDGLALWMNRDSGNVFLCDEDYDVAMMNGPKLEDWETCPYCGHENFRSEVVDEDHKRDEWGGLVCREDAREWAQLEDEDEDETGAQ